MKLRSEIALAGTTAALTLVDPAGLSGRRRTAYRWAVAALSGVGASAIDDSEPPFDSPAARAALGVGTAGAIYASMGLWEKADAGTVGWLQRRGVARPRLVLAVGSLALSVVMVVVERRTAARGPEQD